MLFSSSVCLKSVRIVQNRFHFSTTPLFSSYPLPDMLLAKHILTGKRQIRKKPYTAVLVAA